MKKRDLIVQILEANKDIIIANRKREELRLIMSSFSIFMQFWVAPKQPLYNAEALQKFMIELLPENFYSRKDDISLYTPMIISDKPSQMFHFGCLYADEGIERTIVRVYPDIEIARSASQGQILFYEMPYEFIEERRKQLTS